MSLKVPQGLVSSLQRVATTCSPCAYFCRHDAHTRPLAREEGEVIPGEVGSTKQLIPSSWPAWHGTGTPAACAG